MKNIWLPAFFAFSFLQIIGVITGLEGLCMISKPFLMPMLALWLAAETQHSPSMLRKGWLMGLAFSTLGDVLLMFEGSSYFILGLSAFLLAHLSYIFGISKGLSDTRGFLLKNPWWFIPFLVYPIALMSWLFADIPAETRIPVVVYAIVIATMAQSVANLYGYIPGHIFWMLMGGAILFVLSDSLIAVNKFGHPFAGGRLAVISTYIVGQYLLARGVVSILRN